MDDFAACGLAGRLVIACLGLVTTLHPAAMTIAPWCLLTAPARGAEQADQASGAKSKMPGTVPPLTNAIGMKLARIPAGEFWMGSPDSDKEARDDEKPRHRVRITKPFYMG